MTHIISLTEFSRSPKQVMDCLSAGGLIFFPTDTVYGFIADATSEKAVNKLIAFKNRPPGKAISVFVSDEKMMKEIVTISQGQEQILRKLLPGPFTIILQSEHKVSKLLESEKGTLGVRLPDYPLVTELVKQYGKPTTATSANVGGRSPHYSVESFLKDVPENKMKLIDLIVDGGKLPRNKPSTIIDLTQPQIKLLRQGDITFKDSETFVTKSEGQTKKTAQFIYNRLKKSSDKPLAVILEGEMGTGKTQFVKGVAEQLGIMNIISPTFVIYYEYETLGTENFDKLYHFDLYNIEDESEYKDLGIEKLLIPGNLLMIEWGEKLGDLYNQLEEKADIVYIKMKYVSEGEREIITKY